VLPASGVVVSSDAEARAVVEEARRGSRPVPALGLVGGDLCRTLGGTGDRERLVSEAAVSFAVDLGAVVADGTRHWFVAHLVARSRTWTRLLVAANAQWMDGWNVAPRAHPGDGLVDVFDATLRLGDLAKIRRRLPRGAHLPHPRVSERRVAVDQVTFSHPLHLRLDGVPLGRVRSLQISVEPDALIVVV
jgi:hypothetical protein